MPVDKDIDSHAYDAVGNGGYAQPVKAKKPIARACKCQGQDIGADRFHPEEETPLSLIHISEPTRH